MKCPTLDSEVLRMGHHDSNVSLIITQQVGTDKRDSDTFYQFQPTVSNTKSEKRLQSFLAANQTEVLV